MASGPAPLASETVAMLGPTNTGKTHQCIERMLEHDTGMLGLPLRLLAREVYDKITARIGERRVALVTGEEKRVPKNPAYWICTVEAMPMDVEVDFLAVDEIQLIAHPTRGHVFTNRLLEGRGIHETWFMGSDTAKPLMESLTPAAKFKRRPRLSRLSYAGNSSLGRLPPRSAIVAFSSAQVYELAERVKARRGGAAVVLGALSPRTRNAQVAMYQAGEVDYLIATDAIGMGLNLSVRHVAFAGLSKFDGHETRLLSVPELAQIAGRAGRYLEDGSFGTLDPCPTLPDKVWHAIESHSFHQDRHAIWRNGDLDFSSVDSLLQCLAQPPKHHALRLVARADDTAALQSLARQAEVLRLASDSEGVRLLWQVAQIPDYRKLLQEAHAELLLALFKQLRGSRGQLDESWADERLRRLDDTAGDIDTLMGRIAFVRTWTYISHQPGWLPRAGEWQARTRQIEDRLSDALHERLVQRFVEKRKTHVVASHPRPRKAQSVSPEVKQDSPFARLAELRAALTESAPNDAGPDLDALCDAPHEGFELDEHGVIRNGTHVLGQLRRGSTLSSPDVKVLLPLERGGQLRLERRLRAFSKDVVADLLAPLQEQPGDGPELRGLLYQLRAGLGTLQRRGALEQLQSLDKQQRRTLDERGVRVGSEWVFAPRLLSRGALEVRLALCSTYFKIPSSALPQGASPCAQRPKTQTPILTPLGYVPVGNTVLRCDVYESARKLVRDGSADIEQLSAAWGCEPARTAQLLNLLRARKGRKRRRKRSSRP